MAVLGELPASQGEVKVTGSVSYVPQLPWVFSGSVQQNVLFGLAYEADRYQRAVKAAALKKVGVTLCVYTYYSM